MLRILLAATAALFVTELQAKPVITTASDLPPVRFTLATPPSQAMGGPEFLQAVPSLRREGERLLADYEIKDATLVQRLRLGLANIAVIQGRGAEAASLLDTYRGAEPKPQKRLLGGLTTDLAVAILQAPPGGGCQAAAARLGQRLSGADPELVRDLFLSAFEEVQVASLPYYAGGAAGVMDPVARQRGSIDVDQGMALARWRVAALAIPPCREALVAVGRAWLDAPNNRGHDIWPDRQPSASALAKASPVVVAVWDRGYDTTLFPGQLAREPAPTFGNGPSYDVRLRPTNATMQAPTHRLQERLAAQMALDKGELDLTFGLDTLEAQMFAAFARSAPAAEQGAELQASLENHGRVHGTACASEIADGAPYVRLYNVAALPWGMGEDGLAIPYDEATIARWAAAVGRIGARLRAADVRVVSMSWGLTPDEISDQLLDRGLETDPVRARARAAAMHRTMADALDAMMRASPHILFVHAAGNSDQADAIQRDAVTLHGAPNLLTVGATGANGRPTSFTVFGPSVAIYAQGEAVPLRWPGNVPAHESGTSMAAPLVARAAAQVLAVRPTLSTEEVRQALLVTATDGDGGLKLLHPAAAVAWAQAH